MVSSKPRLRASDQLKSLVFLAFSNQYHRRFSEQIEPGKDINFTVSEGESKLATFYEGSFSKGMMVNVAPLGTSSPPLDNELDYLRGIAIDAKGQEFSDAVLAKLQTFSSDLVQQSESELNIAAFVLESGIVEMVFSNRAVGKSVYVHCSPNEFETFLVPCESATLDNYSQFVTTRLDEATSWLKR